MKQDSANLRIAHIMAGAAKGGAELFYERLCIAQSQQGLNVLPIIRKDSERVQTLSMNGLQPVELKFGGIFDWHTKRDLDKYLNDFKPKVSIAWMNRAASFMPQGNWVSVGRLGGFYNLKYYKKCDHLVGNTQGIVEWVKQQGWPENRVHYVPNFAREFPKVTANRPDYIPHQAPFILALGRLHPNKGFDVLIKAMAYLNGVHLLIAGEGKERQKLQRLAQDLKIQNRIHMPGWINNISEIIQACNVVVCSSRHEPLGNVVLEGFAAKKPVVAMASQGPLELIMDGVNGILSPLENEVMMAKSIHTLLDRPEWAGQLALEGHQKFLQEFSKQVVLQKWFNFLSTVEKI